MTTCEKASRKILISLNSMTAAAGAAAITGGVFMKMKMFSSLKSAPVGKWKMNQKFLLFMSPLILQSYERNRKLCSKVDYFLFGHKLS